MRVHRIVLRNYRGVEEADIDFPAQGVIIVEGDNEVGKTSLVEALDLLLNERDDASKRAVKAVKPAGRDVGAEVEAELSSGPYRFRYRKRWHKQKETVLDISEPHRSQLTGREAHDRVRAILDETLDSSLWEALRLTQGAELAQSAFAGGSLGRALDQVAGGDAAGEREDDLWDRITAERDRYWTATGQPKNDRQVAARELAEAQVRVADLERVLASLQADADQVGRLVVRARELADQQSEHDERVADLGKQVDAVQSRRTEVERLAAARDAARARRDQARTDDERRADQVRRLAEAEAVVAGLRGVVDASAPARLAGERRLAEVRGEVETARAVVAAAETAHRRAVSDRDYRRDLHDLELLSERQARVADAEGRRSVADAVVRSSHVDDALLKRIEEAEVEVARAEAVATAGAATVGAEALDDVTVDIDGRTVALETGQQHEITVAGTAEVVLPGVLKLVVTAGAKDRELADALAAAQAGVVGLCAEGQVADVTEARRVAGLRAEAARVVVQAEEAIARDLRDLTLEGMAARLQGLQQRIAGYEAERPAESPLPADLDAARVLTGELEADLDEARARLARLEQEHADAVQAMQDLRTDDAGRRASLDQRQGVVAQEQALLDTARGDDSDEDVADRLRAADAVLVASETVLTEAEDELAAQDPDTVEGLLASARAAAKRSADELHANDVSIRDLRARLAVKGEEGLASSRDDARSELARLVVAHEQLEARAVAAKVLYETFAARRMQAHQRYIAPFRERIERLGRVVFGPTLEVELDDELRIARRTLDGVSLDFADLSTGAKEQLGMLSRLACASIVAEDGGAPVVFDDALGWSDPGRLARMGAAIDLAGRSCQVIVLTCTPGRYAGVGRATVVRLPG